MPSSTTIHAVGVILLVLSPIIGGVLSSALSYQKSFTLVINGFTGGMLLGMGLLHMLKEAVHGYPVQDDEVEYPYPYLITGCMLLFMFMLTNFIPIGVEMTLRSQSSSGLVDKVNITAIAFFFGLAIHGIFEGFAAGILDSSPASWVTLILLIVHKCIEFAALSTVLLKLQLSTIIYYAILLINVMPCLVTFIVTFATAASYSSLTGAVFSALGSGTFLYLSLGHLIPEVLDSNSSHHCHPTIADKPSGTVVTPYNNIEVTDNSIDGLKNESNSNNVPTIDCSGDNAVRDTENLKELLYFKLIAFTGICIGFTAFALLALAPHDHDQHDHGHHDDGHHDDHGYHDDGHHDDHEHHDDGHHDDHEHHHDGYFHHSSW